MSCDNQISEIIYKSLTLSERICSSSSRIIDINTFEDIIQLWHNNFKKDSLDYFDKRISWEGLNLNNISNLLYCNPKQDISEWHKILELIITTIKTNSSKVDLSDIIEVNSDIPFQDYFAFIIKIAEQQLLSHIDKEKLYSIFSKKSINDLKIRLLKQLSELCSETLFLEFSKSRTSGSELLSKFLNTNLNSAYYKYSNYNSFIQRLLTENGIDFFLKYPVLAKFISITILNWINSNLIFINNVIKDYKSIIKYFHLRGNINEPLKINSIESNLSDYHNSGQSVLILEFANKSKIVYKPKSLSIDYCYNKFLQWVNDHGFSRRFKLLRILHMGNKEYGYSEFIEYNGCKIETEIEEFYFKSGALLCIFHLLRATDCHFENFIAHGHDIILVDCETLLQPNAKSAKTNKISTNAYPEYFNSVLRTGFLPIWKFNKDHKYSYDVSGIGPFDIKVGIAKEKSWINTNTDEMSRGYSQVQIPFPKNIPLFNDKPINACDYVNDIIAGFSDMYSFLLWHKDLLLGINSPLMAFRNKKNRFIFRGTEVYGYALKESQRTEYLTNGLYNSIKLDMLSRAHLWPDEKGELWNIYKFEIDQLNNLDIPFFKISTSSRGLILDDTRIKSYFNNSGFKEMITVLSNLSQFDLYKQLDVIEGTMLARNIKPEISEKTKKKVVEFKKYKHRLFEPNQFINEAIDIARIIVERSIIDDGKMTWRPLIIDSISNRYQYKPIGYNLYNGKCGIALFLSALYYVTKDDKYKHLTLKCISDVLDILAKPNSVEAIKGIGSLGIGAGDGISSIIYSLVKISYFLNDQGIITKAENAASLINEEMILSDYYDILGGSAGCLLGLITLYKENKNQNTLSLAKSCGNYLVKNQKCLNGSTPTWYDNDNIPLMGFSHGAAGISYSLLMLYKLTSDEKYKKSAAQGIIFEQEYFDKLETKFKKRRDLIDVSELKTSWCNGTSGIVLGRIGGISEYSNAKIQDEIAAGIDSVLKTNLHFVDHVCCGNFGRIETLLYYGHFNNNLRILGEVNNRTSILINKAHDRGGFLIHPKIPKKFTTPGFFQGLAGIGYQLLRIANPYEIPSILLFE